MSDHDAKPKADGAESLSTVGLGIDVLIAMWSMRPKPGSPEGDAWERGARWGWEQAERQTKVGAGKTALQPVCEVRGTKRRKWLYWYGKDWEANPVGTTFYSAADVAKLEAERDQWRQRAEALARAVLMDEAGYAA